MHAYSVIDNGENVVVTSVESHIKTHLPVTDHRIRIHVFAENFFSPERAIQSAHVSQTLQIIIQHFSNQVRLA